MRPAIEYARYSPRPKAKRSNGDPGHDCESIEVQLSRLDALCAALGLDVAGRYEDRLKTGATVKGRDGLEAAIKHACRIKGVFCVYDFSRMSRSVEDSFAILRRLRKHGAELRSVLDGVATDTAMGEMMFGIKTSIDQYARRLTAEKTSDSMIRHQFEGGRRMTRLDRCPFGYCPGADGSSLEPDPAEQAIIATIRQLAGEGLSNRGICRAMDNKGTLRRSKTWDGAHALVAAILARGA